MQDKNNYGIAFDRVKRFTAEYSIYSDSDYQNVWEDFDKEFFRENDPSDAHAYSVVFLCVLITLLSVIFLASITINVSILMVFARKQTLRTTSNRYQNMGAEDTSFLKITKSCVDKKSKTKISKIRRLAKLFIGTF